MKRAILAALVGVALMPTPAGAHTRTPWHSDKSATLDVFRDVQPFGHLACEGYGKQRGTRHRRFTCAGFDGEAFWTFDVRFTTKGIRYSRIESVG